MANWLAKLANNTERSRSYHVQRALEEYMEDCADLQIALERLRDPHDRLIPSKEFKKKLGL